MASLSLESIFGSPDAKVGSGYGTLKSRTLGPSDKAEETWPYATFTDIEVSADESPDEEETSARAIKKKKVKHGQPVDSIGQLTYRSHSYVNGATRGLTGIMSGMEPRAILEQLIDEVRPMDRKRNGDVQGSIMGQKPIGTGAPQLTMMHPSGASRTRPGQGMGSKKGWFSPHPPKEDDPENYDHGYTLQDIANSSEEKPLKRVAIRLKLIKKGLPVSIDELSIIKSYVLALEESFSNCL
jgi:hypothetical protein